jgi:hypothetical protein
MENIFFKDGDIMEQRRRKCNFLLEILLLKVNTDWGKLHLKSQKLGNTCRSFGLYMYTSTRMVLLSAAHFQISKFHMFPILTSLIGCVSIAMCET